MADLPDLPRARLEEIASDGPAVRLDVEEERAVARELLRRRAAETASGTGIYIASKAKHGARWIALRASGVPIVSTWIDEYGENETTDWQDLYVRCIREAASAAACIVYVEPEEVQKGAYVEMGAALASGRPVFWVGPETLGFTRHPGVRVVATVRDAVAFALEAQRQTEARRPGGEAFARLRRAVLAYVYDAPDGQPNGPAEEASERTDQIIEATLAWLPHPARHDLCDARAKEHETEAARLRELRDAWEACFPEADGWAGERSGG